MSRAAKKGAAAEQPRCSCAESSGSHGALWTCCVCHAWNGKGRTACVNCHHERGGEPRAVRWDPLPSAARFEPPKGGPKP